MNYTKKEMAKGVFDAMNKRDFSIADDIFAETIEFDFPGAARVSGSRKVLIMLNALLRKYSELQFDVKDILIDEERACVEWNNKGISIDGNNYENRGITLIHFTDNKISLLSDYFKDTSFINNK